MSCITLDSVEQAFLAATPLIAQQIQDLTVKTPVWLRDLWEIETFPEGAGTILEQIVFRGGMPQIERDFTKWKKLNNNTGCNPGEGPDCTYNWSTLGGYGFDRKITELMERDYRSPEFCIHNIQTTAHFREVMAKVIENLFQQVSFIKELNIGQTFLTMLAKKFVVDSAGPHFNPHNPYVYRNVLNTRLSALNIEMLEFFYEQMKKMPGTVPYDVVDGAPIYSLMASHQLLARLYRDDPQLRQDVRFSGLANDLVSKYNFMSTIRGMFIAAPILLPRRFIIASTGEPVEVLPYVNGIPAEVGSYTGLNPAYEAATHEEVILHGKYPFKVFTYPTQTSLGGNTTFGPEPTFLENWLWVNPSTKCDPFRRVGYFATSAKIGLSQQYSEGIFGILVERPSTLLMAQWNPVPVCPPTLPTCDNTVPTTTCPCPAVISFEKDPFNALRWFFTFATPVTGVVNDPVQLALGNGGYVTGTLKVISTDTFTASIELPVGFTEATAREVQNVYCDSTLGCSADVICASSCRSGETNQVVTTLSNAIKAIDVDDIVYACMGDGTVQHLTVISVDMSTLQWVFGYATGYGPTDDPTGAGDTAINADMVCDRSGIVRVCVPTATDATCPSCAAPSATPCSGAQP